MSTGSTYTVQRQGLAQLAWGLTQPDPNRARVGPEFWCSGPTWPDPGSTRPNPVWECVLLLYISILYPFFSIFFFYFFFIMSHAGVTMWTMQRVRLRPPAGRFFIYFLYLFLLSYYSPVYPRCITCSDTIKNRSTIHNECKCERRVYNAGTREMVFGPNGVQVVLFGPWYVFFFYICLLQ